MKYVDYPRNFCVITIHLHRNIAEAKSLTFTAQPAAAAYLFPCFAAHKPV